MYITPWGETPQDVDAHLLGPVEEIYFFNKESLTSYPFAQLDVDDLESFGPEFITIFQFPDVGTYRYFVENYSETFNPGLTESPARVELNINGTISTFVPPPNEDDNAVWDVFEFIVSEDGSFVLNIINTWSPF